MPAAAQQILKVIFADLSFRWKYHGAGFVCENETVVYSRIEENDIYRREISVH